MKHNIVSDARVDTPLVYEPFNGTVATLRVCWYLRMQITCEREKTVRFLFLATGRACASYANTHGVFMKILPARLRLLQFTYPKQYMQERLVCFVVCWREEKRGAEVVKRLYPLQKHYLLSNYHNASGL